MKNRNLTSGVFFHGAHHIRNLKGYALQSGARNMRLCCATGYSQNRAPGVHIPVGRAKTRERRNKHNPAGIRHGFRKGVYLRRGGNYAKTVAQPLNCASAVKNAAFQRICSLSADAPRNRGNKT